MALHPVLELADLLHHDASIRRSVSITCMGKRDGGGAQVHAIMSAIAFARATGVKYVHSPFVRIGHSPIAADWALRWERFFSLGAGEEQLSEAAVPIETFLASQRDLPGRRVVAAPFYHPFLDQNADVYRGVLGDLRQKYAISDKGDLPSHRTMAGLTVGVHLRRGDVKPDNARRYTEDEVVLRTIEGIRDVLYEFSQFIRINLFSEGPLQSFHRFACGCDLHLDTDPFDAFHNLVCSDVLVLAKSSFSYAAALLSPNVCLYEPFWHRPLSSWIVRDPAGNFDRAGFRELFLRWSDKTPSPKES